MRIHSSISIPAIVVLAAIFAFGNLAAAQDAVIVVDSPSYWFKRTPNEDGSSSFNVEHLTRVLIDGQPLKPFSFGGFASYRVPVGREFTIQVPHRFLGHPHYIGRENETLAIHDVLQILWGAADQERPLSDYRKSGRTRFEPRIRYTCQGYEGVNNLDVSGTGTACTMKFDKVAAATIKFNWKVEYALNTVSIVEQEIDGKQLISKEELRSLGNITYHADNERELDPSVGTGRPDQPPGNWDWGTVWIPENADVRIEVGRSGYDKGIPKTDERYVVHKYEAVAYPGRKTTAESSGSDFEPTQAFNLNNFQMTMPTDLIFRWRRQLRVKLGPILKDAARPLPYVRVDRDFDRNVFPPRQPHWINPYAGLNQHEMPERWYDHGTALYIAAPAEDRGVRLNGWRSATGHFRKPEGEIPHSLLQRRRDVVLEGLESDEEGRTAPVIAGASWGLAIPSLEKPTSVTWDYGNFVFKRTIPIGLNLDPRLMNEEAAGSPITRKNMPLDISLTKNPKITMIDTPQGSALENSIIWDEIGKRLWPLRPGKYMVEFQTDDPEKEVFVEVTAGFPGDLIPNSGNPEAAELREQVPANLLREFSDNVGRPDLGRGITERSAFLLHLTEPLTSAELDAIDTAIAELEQRMKAEFPELGTRTETNQLKGLYHQRFIFHQKNTFSDGTFRDGKAVGRYFADLDSADWRQYYARAHYRHIAGAPPVKLDTNPNDTFHFSRLAYFQPDSYDKGEGPALQRGRANATDGLFTNEIGGRSVLIFTKSVPGIPLSFPASGDLTQEEVFVRIVETRQVEKSCDWNQLAPMIDTSGGATIGEPLASTFDRAEKKTGWLYQDGRKQLHNPDIYNRDEASGPIIPVNLRLDPWTPADGYGDELVVVWYENFHVRTDFGGNDLREPPIDWPWKPAHYPSHLLKWPNQPGQIVMASRMGSGGLNGRDPQREFSTDRYSNVRIYHQLDPEKPGYNPNEEHAIVAESLFSHPTLANGKPDLLRIEPRSDADPPPAAFAFRKDLNVIETNGYTSHPFVLVEYFDNDPSVNDFRMAVYGIEYENEIYKFSYGIKATEPVAAPYPLNTVIGLSNMNDSQLGTRGPGDVQNTDGTYYSNAQKPIQQATYWIDPAGTTWAISGPTGPMPNPHFFGHFYYPLHNSFWHPTAKTGDKQIWLEAVATSNGKPDFGRGPGKVRYNTKWPDAVPTLKAGETLTFAGGEYRSDHPTTILPETGRLIDTPGLPGVIGWAAGQILFDSRNPSMTGDWTDKSKYTARLTNPLLALEVPLDIETMRKQDEKKKFDPSTEHVTLDGLLWRFPRLPASLQRRIYFDPLGQTAKGNDFVTGKLGIRGYVSDRTLGDNDLTADPDPVYLLEPNILMASERDRLKELFDGPAWKAAVDELYKVSRDPHRLVAEVGQTEYLAGLDTAQRVKDELEKKDLPEKESIYKDAKDRLPLASFGPGLALVPNDAAMDPDAKFKEGYVTLVENAHPLKPDLSPVTLYVVKVTGEHRYRGSIKTMFSPNAFDERATLRHTGDFGANVDDLVYEWWHRPAASDIATHPYPGEADSKWQLLAGETSNEVILEGNPSLMLGDNLFFARYRHKNDNKNNDGQFGADPNQPFPWEWAGAGNSPQRLADGSTRYLPQLLMGWVKRVLDAINPYEARYAKFRDHESPATYASMIQQAGGPFVGPVALNPDKNVVENVGLIQLYSTLLDRARKLSIDLEQPVVGESIYQALLLAATRTSDLYMLLGNEAYSDAQDPTIGIGTSDTDYGTLAPALFAFQNQEASLLHEELALLRGTDFGKGSPVQNRLFWNFVKGQGEAAYATNYQIKDVNNDGFINERDARLLYPQGHGDAWGHYLSAAKSQYTLLQHPQFRWKALPELYNLLDIVLNVDYLDEVKFARTAAAKARAGAEIVDLTHRLAFTEHPNQRFPALQDRNAARAWGVSEWSRRAGQAALFDWAVANALLPPEANDDTGQLKDNLNRIDRGSVSEIRQISANHGLIQQKLDEACAGMNPLGFVTDAVAFDIDPIRVDRTSRAPATHFEQIYERAVKACQNAVTTWDYANGTNRRLRQVGESVARYQHRALEQDLAYRNRLIEIFGLPYEGTIGPGQAYPAGYTGPDTMLYFYVDQARLLAEHLPQTEPAYAAAKGEFDEYYNDKISNLKDHPAGRVLPGVSEVKPCDDSKYRFFEGTRSVDLKLPFFQRPAAMFSAPEDWGRRKANGRLQDIYAQLVLAEFELQRKVDAYNGYLTGLQSSVHKLCKVYEYHSAIGREKEAFASVLSLSKGVQMASDIIADVAEAQRSETQQFTRVLVGSNPLVVGMSNDVAGPLRLAVGTSGGILSTTFQVIKTTAEVAKKTAQAGDIITQFSQNIVDINRSKATAIAQAAIPLKQEFSKEAGLRAEIFVMLKQVEQVSNQYLTTLQEGQRLLDERLAFNKRIAAGTQQNRYQDLTFRFSRNDALQKYRSTFDTAARYVHLAAMAYDYETNLSPEHPASARRLVEELAATRNLGLWVDGQPQMGRGGLAGVLAKLRDNFDVLNGQLGFNNPQTETDRFSLRAELFRIGPDNQDHEFWRKRLKEFRVKNLWDNEDFRLHCRPFASPLDGPQPALVIPFSTTISEGRNFFNQEAGAFDHLFDPSQYATKIRSVGLWFTNYPSSDLVATPRVYLVPAGTDIMRVPDSPTLQQRYWNVVDQRVAVPHRIGQRDLMNPNWMAAADYARPGAGNRRQFSRFRAFQDLGGNSISNEMTWNSRLVGRSVWNTRWLLIIPGAALHADPERGLNTLVGDALHPGITDIKLLFQTYSHSGN